MSAKALDQPVRGRLGVLRKVLAAIACEQEPTIFPPHPSPSPSPPLSLSQFNLSTIHETNLSGCATEIMQCILPWQRLARAILQLSEYCGRKTKQTNPRSAKDAQYTALVMLHFKHSPQFLIEQQRLSIRTRWKQARKTMWEEHPKPCACTSVLIG